ncbi:MAG: 4Fe-4S dicluster domain-containing protein [Chitinophagaceae bacterium]|nr:4Fe-4S dicluster domain-containing protein [Chitinophagaceae bacterium]
MNTFFSAIGNLFKEPVTTKYPFEPTYKPDDYRGLIGFEESLCIWCRRCELACPPGAIVFSQDMEGKQTYHYNRAVCIYCGECVRACPKEGALFQTAEPAPCALKEENINNGWNQLFDEALDSREKFAAEKKRKAAEKAAADKAAAAAKKAAEEQAGTNNETSAG